MHRGINEFKKSQSPVSPLEEKSKKLVVMNWIEIQENFYIWAGMCRNDCTRISYSTYIVCVMET